MNKILYFILHPFKLYQLWSNDGREDDGIDILYALFLCVAAGIWLVVQRQRRSKNSPIPFHFNSPKEADPSWTSFKIHNPNLESHLEDEKIQPLMLPDRRYITCFDPSNGLHLSTIMADNEPEIAGKIQRAREAQKTWMFTDFTQRRRVIRSLQKWMVENQDLCARVACRDTGKTLVDAALGEILVTCCKMEWIMDHGEEYLMPESRKSNFIQFYKKSEVHYDPKGVVAAIVSWNYPLHNAWSPILASIFAGNAVVLKCSENVIWSTSWFVNIIRACLEVCGHNPELVQLVCCWPEQAAALTKSPYIKHITFIGSETVGRQIAQDATVHLTPVTLELGGKDPAIILPNTDLKQWISIWMRGIFQNAGQNCIGIEKLIVHVDQYDELYEMLEKRIEKLRCGSVTLPSDQGYLSPVDVGAMISDNRFDALEALIKHAAEDGAKIVGGERYRHVYHDEGTYFLPTLVGLTHNQAAIAQQELFAPIALVMGYETVEEAVELANGTRYGLGASVFGPDQDLCLEVARELDCGMVAVNDFAVFYMNQDLPFGGTKASGYGRFGGPEGLRSLTNPKVIVYDWWPSLIQTSIPNVLDYPIRSLGISFEFTSGLIRFFYADSWRARIQGLIALIQAQRK